MPELHVITGSNGVGKSSVGFEFLPQHIKDVCTVFDGDKLALNKTKELFATKLHSYKEAKKLANDWILEYFNQQVNEAITNRANFVYEGHFRETSSWTVLDRFRKSGYAIHMLFFGLVNPERSEMHVLERALSGGHNVSRAEIEWNYYGNLALLDSNFKLLNELRILDQFQRLILKCQTAR